MLSKPHAVASGTAVAGFSIQAWLRAWVESQLSALMYYRLPHHVFVNTLPSFGPEEVFKCYLLL